MKNLTANTYTSSSSHSWIKSERKLKQLFTKLTGYDYMTEESRKDIQPQTTSTIPAGSANTANAYVFNLREQYLYLFNRE